MRQVINIVDDDPAFRDSLQTLLEALGYVAASHASGAEFLDAYDGDPQAVLLLDVNLPEVDGLQVLGTLRRRWPRLPVIMMSGMHAKLERIRAALPPGVALLAKPFSDRDLVAQIERHARPLS